METQTENLLRALRRSRNWTLDELAERSGVSKGGLSRIERGLRRPSAATLVKVANAFDLSELSGLLEPWVKDRQ